MPRPPFTRQALQSFVVTSSTQINARSWTTWDSFPWLIEANKRTGDPSEKLLLNEIRLHWKSLFPTIKITSITRGNIYDNMSQRASSNLNFIFCLFVLLCFVLFFFIYFQFSRTLEGHETSMSTAYLFQHFLAENVLNGNLNFLLDIDIGSELEPHLTSLLNNDSSIEQIHLKFSTSDATTDLP